MLGRLCLLSLTELCMMLMSVGSILHLSLKKKSQSRAPHSCLINSDFGRILLFIWLMTMAVVTATSTTLLLLLLRFGLLISLGCGFCCWGFTATTTTYSSRSANNNDAVLYENHHGGRSHRRTATTTTTTTQEQPTATTSFATRNTRLWVGDAQGNYYGESSGSYMIKEFNTYEQLEEVVQLSSQPLPERPDGIVSVVKFTSASNPDARATEAEYERLARQNPATVFLRCFAEYENADLLLGKAQVSVFPTFDIFYGGNRVGRVEGSSYTEVEELLEMYQFQNSKLDLFSEDTDQSWGDGRAAGNPGATPRTTARFISGYDWNKKQGAFDDAAEKAEKDFMDTFGGWLPNMEDE